jgi:hypothetical protein
MTPPAIKIGRLNVSQITHIPMQITDLRNEYGVYKDETFYGIRYYKINKEAEDELKKEILPSHLLKNFDMYIMLINYDNILPHIDSDIETVINYYIKTSDATTHFWKLKENTNATSFKISNQTDGCIYSMDNLEHIFEFDAKDGDIWMLNVKEIHSVIGSNDLRIAFCFQSKLGFNEIFF